MVVLVAQGMCPLLPQEESRGLVAEAHLPPERSNKEIQVSNGNRLAIVVLHGGDSSKAPKT